MNIEQQYTIAVVVDPNFGDKLLEVAKRVHVWVCDTPVNRQAAEAVRVQMEPEGEWNEQGVTTFRISLDEDPEDMIISHLSIIDLHHNEYSHDPAWSQIEVYGVDATPRLRQELQEYGVTHFRETQEGFVCWREELWEPPAINDAAP